MKGLLYTYLTTGLGSLVAVFYPFIGLLIYINFAILKPEFMWRWVVPEGNYSRIVAIALLIGWALRGFGKWSFGKATPVVWSIIGFWIWTVAAAPLARNQAVAWNFVENLTKIILPFVVGMTLIDTVSKLKQLAWTLVLSQGYVAYELNGYYYFNNYNMVWEEGFGGMDNNSVAIGMVTGVGLAFFLGLKAPNWWQKALAYGSALMMAHVVLFSFSRGGQLALLITGIAAFMLIPKQARSTGMLVVTVMIILALAGPQVRQRFSSIFAEEKERDESATSRIKLWQQNIELMYKYPMFGIGPHHWPEVAHEYGWFRGKEGHSLWLQIGAELGVPGLMLLVCFYGYTIVRLWPITWESTSIPDPFFRDVARMVIAALLGFAVAAQFVSLTFLEVPYYTALLGAGALRLLTTKKEEIEIKEDEYQQYTGYGADITDNPQAQMLPGGRISVGQVPVGQLPS